MTSLLSLPNEILIEVFLALEAVRDIKALQTTCARLNDIVEQTPTLLYHLHKRVAGILDTPSTAPIQDRLDALRRREDAWSTLRFPRCETLTLDFPSASFYDMADGKLVLVRDGVGNPLAAPEGYTFFTLPRLSQEGEQGELGVVEGVTVGTNVRPYDLRLSKKEDDLIVVLYTQHLGGSVINLGVYARFQSRTTGRAHPLAENPDLQVLQSRYVRDQWLSFEIVGDWVVVALSQPLRSGLLDEISRVNWKTGRSDNIHTAPPRTCAQLLFLSETRLVMCNPYAHSLDLFELVVDDGNARLRPLASLSLPPLELGVSIRAVESRGDPYIGTRPFASPSQPTNAWRTDPEESVVALHFELNRKLDSGRAGRVLRYFVTLVVHVRALLDLSFASSRPDKAVSWQDWGPKHARWFAHGEAYPKCLSGASAGQRFAMVERGRIRVYDFNRLRVRKKGCIGGTFAGFDGWFVDGTLESELEVAVEEREMEEDYKGVMLDGERVLSVKVQMDGRSIECIDIFIVG